MATRGAWPGAAARPAPRCPSPWRGGCPLGLAGRDQPADGGAGGHREAPVEQRRALLPAARRPGLGTHQRDDQPASVALGRTDVGVPGDVGEAGLAADGARVREQELVVVLDLVAARVLRRLRGYLGALRAVVAPEILPGEAGARDERQV